MNENEEFEFRLRHEREMAQAKPAAPPSYLDTIKANGAGMLKEAANLGAGAVRGAGSIGDTLMTPVDAAARAMGIQNDYIGRTDRREAMTGALGNLGADTNSVAFKTGKLGGEIAGTAGAGGVLANGLRGAAGYAGLVSEAAPLANALATNGFRAGVGQGTAANILTRAAGGSAAAGAQVGLADPEHAGTAALIGGALPGVAKVAGAIGSGASGLAQDAAKGLMKSSLKATEKARRTGDADVAAQTLLDYGINPTNAGVAKLKTMIGDLNDQIASAIKESGAKIDKEKVLAALAETRKKFGNQVSPTGDLSAIDGVAADFAKSHATELPIQLAQDLKQGTYRVLKGKYGEAGSASTEAQKALARGLKDEIAAAAPAVAPLNAEESRLLRTLVVTERAALRDSNKHPVDLGSVLALASGHPGAMLGTFANSNAAIKGYAARGLNSLSSGPSPVVNALAGPAAYRAIPSTTRR